MNIGIVTPQLCNYGGAEIYLLECLKRWQHEMDIHLYTGSFEVELFYEYGIDPKNIKVSLLPTEEIPAGQFGLFYDTVVSPRIWERALGEHDVYFLYLAPTHLIRKSPSVWFAAEPIRMLYDLRHCFTSQGISIDVHLYPRLSYETLFVPELETVLELIEHFDQVSHVDCIATNSHSTAQYLENIYGGRKPDQVVYPGINPKPPTPHLARETPQAITVGRLWNHKRTDLAIRALSYLSSGDLVVVGAGPELEPLKKLTRELELSSRVRFAGAVSNSELERLYAESSCCVYTPVREPFGMVPLEAAAFQTPVVATRGGGYSEILTDECAVFVPDDPERIGAAMQSIFDAPEKGRKMGEAGRKIVAAHTWDRTATELSDLFQSVMSKKARNTPIRSDRPKLGAHFYPWYRTGEKPEHWNENREFSAVADHPTNGFYSSNDPAMVRQQAKAAVDAGLDFLVVNWQITFIGANPLEVESTRLLCEIIEKEDLPLSVSLLLAFSTDDTTVIEDVRETVRTEFLGRPSYQTVRGRPVLWYFLSDSFLGSFFHDRKKFNIPGASYIATGGLSYSSSLPKLLRDSFQGWCYYSPLQVCDPDSWEHLWRSSYQDAAKLPDAIRTFTVCPGFDDTHLVSEKREALEFRRIGRKSGSTYQEMNDFALSLSPSPDLIVVTSWNEYHENTHIESSQHFGESYLKATLALKDRILDTWEQSTVHR